jgi:hypothetical protein
MTLNFSRASTVGVLQEDTVSLLTAPQMRYVLATAHNLTQNGVKEPFPTAQYYIEAIRKSNADLALFLRVQGNVAAQQPMNLNVFTVMDQVIKTGNLTVQGNVVGLIGKDKETVSVPSVMGLVKIPLIKDNMTGCKFDKYDAIVSNFVYYVGCFTQCSGGEIVPTVTAASVGAAQVTFSAANISSFQHFIRAIGMDQGDKSLSLTGVAWSDFFYRQLIRLASKDRYHVCSNGFKLLFYDTPFAIVHEKMSEEMGEKLVVQMTASDACANLGRRNQAGDDLQESRAFSRLSW